MTTDHVCIAVRRLDAAGERLCRAAERCTGLAGVPLTFELMRRQVRNPAWW